LARSKHLDLQVDGYVISIEKRPRKEIGMSESACRARFKIIDNQNPGE